MAASGHAPAPDHGFDGDLHVAGIVERIEDAKDVDARLGGVPHELPDHVVGITRVAHGGRGSQQHLEGNVGDGLAQPVQAIPGGLAQETHGRVERGSTPELEREEVAVTMSVDVRDPAHVVGSHSRRQKGLVRVPEGGVRNEHLRAISNPIGEFPRPVP